MIAHNTQGIGMAEVPEIPTFSLPPETVIQHIAFVAESAGDQTVLVEFPAPLGRRAVSVKSQPFVESEVRHAHATPKTIEPQHGHERGHVVPAANSDQLAILIIPAPVRDGDPEFENKTLAAMREWVDAAATVAAPSLLMTLQSARIYWTPERIAILAPPDRLETVRGALIEATYYQAEIRAIEWQLGTAWPQLEADMPLAFEFEANSIPKRKQLRRRFQEVLLLRARLARLGPHVHCPHHHPPTLASQIGERLRERTRLVHRHEFLTEQVELFERVYDMCGQRSSDFMLARSGNTLEWIIIILLLVQTLFTVFEIVSNTNAADATSSATEPSSVNTTNSVPSPSAGTTN